VDQQNSVNLQNTRRTASEKAEPIQNSSRESNDMKSVESKKSDTERVKRRKD
jgi:hypothetical protein